MASIQNYASLVEDMQAYNQRGDARFVEHIPAFIMLGQRTLCLDVKPLELKNVFVGELQAGNPIVPKDVRWLTQESFQISTGYEFKTRKFLYNRSIEYGRQYAPEPSDLGEPLYYTTNYNTYEYFLFKTPDLNYPYESVYYQLPQLLDDTNQTNILTERYPRALLYACLKETTPYLRNDDRTPMWDKLYQAEIQAIAIQDQSRFTKKGPGYA